MLTTETRSTTQPCETWEVWVEVKDWRTLARFVLLKNPRVSHRDIAAACGLKSHTYIGKLLRGKVKTLNPEAVVKLCHFLELPIDEFFVTKSSGDPGRGNRKAAA